MSPVLDVFVPDGDSREDTAVLLTGTASEHGIAQNEIKATQGGFFISEALAALVYDDPAEEAAETPDEAAAEAAAAQAAADEAAAKAAADAAAQPPTA